MAFVPKVAFITGGGTGIGRGLASALHARGTQVIIGGRREGVLQAVCHEHPGMLHQVLDVSDPENIKTAAHELLQRCPGLDCLVNNAGVQRQHDFSRPSELDLTWAQAEIDANFRGVVFLSAALLPHLLRQKSAKIVNISSGLAYVPITRMPIYCATKAAVHSFTVSLRHQLKKTSVRVLEIAPPAVSTDLHDYMGPHGKSVGIPMADFMNETLAALDRGEEDFAVEQAKAMKSTVSETYARIFAGMNPG